MRAAQKNDVIKFLDDWAKLTYDQKAKFCEHNLESRNTFNMVMALDFLANNSHILNKELQAQLDFESALLSAKVDRACGVKA